MRSQPTRHHEADDGCFTRSRLLASAGAAGLALLGLNRVDGVFGDALAARSAAFPPRVSRFVSRPDLRPPLLTIRHRPRNAGKGHLFIAPSSGPGQRGVLIFDDLGQPVWFHPTTPDTATAFRASTLRGKPVLTWWEGKFSNEGPRPGRLRDRGHVVSRDRPDSCRRPPGRRPARVPDHERGHGARDQERGRHPRPARVRRQRGRDAVRRRGAGDRDPERQGPVRVAKPRPCRARRIARAAERESLRLLPHQLDRRRRGRPPPRLGEEYLGGLQGASPHRAGAVAARRPQEQFRDGQGHRDRLAARRTIARRRPC